jgi:hypothetical protein
MKTNHRAITYNIRYIFLSYTLVLSSRDHYNKWLIKLSHCFDAVKFSERIILTVFALHEIATKEQILAAIVLCVKMLPKYVDQ